MSGFAKGFVTGFANQLNRDISGRLQRADQFFEEQVKLARETGVKNRRRVQEQVGQYTTLAKQLQQIGVPKEIIMAVANQDPATLTGFYETVNKARASGIPLTPEFFNDVVEVGGDFKAPDEDYNTFFSRIFDPLASNYNADPESFERDRKGNIIATLMGFDAMETAQRRLGKTEIIDGLTADQLLDYQDENYRGRPYGESVVTFNPAGIPQAPEGLDLREAGFLTEALEEIETAVGVKLSESQEYDLNTEEDRIRFEADKQRLVVEEYTKRFGQFPAAMDYLTKVLGPVGVLAPEPITEETLPTTEEEISDPTEVTPTETLVEDVEKTLEKVDNGPINPSIERDLTIVEVEGKRYELVGPDGPNNSIYVDEEGNEVIFSNRELRALVRGAP